ncbi:unnamed protein product [Lasius platythorax]|uniref:Uncharacterized protein n=1 Tax=Lasius platythorax TaxID=488582 RepID=A0AAV2P268_9HYME
MHTTSPMPSSSSFHPRLPPPHAKEGTILPGDGCSIRQASREISRATRPRRTRITPSTSTTSLATQCGSRRAHADRRRPSRYIHPPGRNDDVGLRRRSKPPTRGKANASGERDVIGLMGLVVDAIARLRELHMEMRNYSELYSRLIMIAENDEGTSFLSIKV